MAFGGNGARNFFTLAWAAPAPHLELPAAYHFYAEVETEAAQSISLRLSTKGASRESCHAAPFDKQKQDLHEEIDRFYVKPVRGSGSDGVCVARGVDGLIDAARDVIEEVRCYPDCLFRLSLAHMQSRCAHRRGDGRSSGQQAYFGMKA